MNPKRPSPRQTLPDLIDRYQSSGRYTVNREEAQSELGISDEALKKAVQRLTRKRRLAVPRRGFYVIVPLEHRGAGAPPPSWFIHDLMRFHRRPYYVGLLSAAALHGAAHQQPQEFQVVTEGQLRPAVAGRARMRFFSKTGMAATPTIEVNTETGTMRVSTPEATALDLLRYVRGAGHLGNVALVLSELSEKLNAELLVEVAKLEGEMANVQRLGYLLDRVGASGRSAALASCVAERKPRFELLRPDRPVGRSIRDDRWRVIVNETVEVET